MNEGYDIDQLKARHAALESALVEEERKTHPDELAVAEIKKKKLQIKDTIARLEHA